MNSYAKQTLKSRKLIKDVVHEYIVIKDQVIYDLVETKEVQRLRYIGQLGGSSSVFPSAVHTRFNHSLGTYQLALRILQNVSYIEEAISEDEKLLVLCAALLHDVGHGPFSHTFEEVFDFDHETMTQKIILSPETEVHQVLLRVAPDFPAKVASVIDKTYENRTVVTLISGQLDVDRMDYLLRDSFYTGTTYGSIDIGRLLTVLKVKDGDLVIRKVGVPAVEDFLMGRQSMYSQVYQHPSSRGKEIQITKAFRRIKELYDQGYDFKVNIDALIPFLEGDVYNIEAFNFLDDAVMTTTLKYLEKEEDDVLKQLSKSVIHRKLFKRISCSNEQEALLKVEKIKKLFKERGYLEEYYVFESGIDQKVVYDLDKPILVEDGDSKVSLQSLSRLATLIADKNLTMAQHYVYYFDGHEEINELIEEIK